MTIRQDPEAIIDSPVTGKKELIRIHTAVLLFGLAGLFGKVLHLPSVHIVLGRVFFATLSLLPFIFLRRNNAAFHLRKQAFFIPVLSGVILALHWWCFFRSIQLSTVAVGLLTFATFPVFAALLEPVFFKEHFETEPLMLALVTLVGVGLVVPGFEWSSDIVRGAMIGIGSGLTFALLSLLNRASVASTDPMLITFIQDAVAFFVLLPAFFFHPVQPTAGQIGWLAFLGIVCTAGAHTLFIGGLRGIRTRSAAVIASLEPVYGITAAALLLGEIPSFRVWVGGTLILAAALRASVKS